MHINGILDHFNLPEEAEKALRTQNLRQTNLGDGVSTYSGHDSGTAFSFDRVVVYNYERSRGKPIQLFDEIEVVRYYNDGFNHPVEQVRFLAPELLNFDREEVWGKDKSGNDKIVKIIIGEAVSGKYLEEYKRFKAGLTAPGTALARWGVLSDNLVATLAAKSVYSVEQLAAMPRGKIVGIFPQEIVEAHERAQQYVNEKSGRFEVEKQSAEIDELKRAADAQVIELQEMRALVKELTTVKRTRRRRSNGQKQVIIKTEEIKEILEDE